MKSPLYLILATYQLLCTDFYTPYKFLFTVYHNMKKEATAFMTKEQLLPYYFDMGLLLI